MENCNSRNGLKWNYLLLAGSVPFNSLIYYGGRFLAKGSLPVNLTTWLDRCIPLLPWTVLIYWGVAALFWFVSYCVCTLQDKEDGQRFILSHYIGETICFMFFVLFPTTMVRPEISSITIFDRLLELVYQFDSPDNLLPSIHCFASWLCWIGVRKNIRIPRWCRYVSLLVSVAICLSTLTVKQHVIADAAAGILLAELSYYFAGFGRQIRFPGYKTADRPGKI